MMSSSPSIFFGANPMNKRSLARVMRARMAANQQQPLQSPPPSSPHLQDSSVDAMAPANSRVSTRVSLKNVKEWMNASIAIPNDKTESIDANLDEFEQGYFNLSPKERHELLLALAKDNDVNRIRVRELMQQYLSLELPCNSDAGDDQRSSIVGEDGKLSALYRMERNLRDALKPMYSLFFDRLNAHRGGLKLLAILRADLHSLLAEENVPSLRALDLYLKEKLITWLSPAALELHQITWDDSASLLEKIVAYEAVHPIRNLLDLKRRLSVGRRCFGYLHPALPGEPLIFIEVALLKDVAASIEEVLWDSPPTPESEATCALFYSISSTQPGLAGINLGKFLIKRVVKLLRRDMPHITTFATLSPIPGFLQWLISKLASQIKISKLGTKDGKNISEAGSSSTFIEDILLPEEKQTILAGYRKWILSERSIQSSQSESKKIKYTSEEQPSSTSNINILCNDQGEVLNSFADEKIDETCAIEVLHEILTSTEWNRSLSLTEALKTPLLRLCARYLLQEKKRGKALDAVANFHLQNGAMIERINWMADPSEKGINQSAGIMVNYVYRLDMIDENAEMYSSTGHIHASSSLQQFVELLKDPSGA